MLKKAVFLLLVFILFSTRFVGIDWGLPYQMHPDERNMASALQQLNCKEFSIYNFQFSIKKCFNPHFFAYGQFPLYLGFFLLVFFHFVTLKVGEAITYQEAVMVLRFISAIATIVNVWVMVKILELVIKSSSKFPTSSFDKLRASRGKQGSRLPSPTTQAIGGQAISNIFSNSKQEIPDLIFTFSFLIFTFSPYFIQFSHFGTTEALLMLFYSLIVYYSLKLTSESFDFAPGKPFNPSTSLRASLSAIFALGAFTGLAVATKVSSALFAALPLTAFLILGFNRMLRSPHLIRLFERGKKSKAKKSGNKRLIFSTLRGIKERLKISGLIILDWFKVIEGLVIYLVLTALFAVVFSSHNLISLNDFLGVMNYEGGVALGTIKVFYTRQFEYTLPVWSQLKSIFPYVLGWPQFILGLVGFFFLPYGKKENLLRLAFLVYFIPSAFLYAKWTRFMAPIFPLMSVFAAVVLIRMYRYIAILSSKVNLKLEARKAVAAFFVGVVLVVSVIPGVAYLAIYENPDVRFEASEWLYENIPAESYLLFETANVVDVPIPPPSSRLGRTSPAYNDEQVTYPHYEGVSFDFYGLDENPDLQAKFREHLAKADYIFIPSRRVFKNHTCFHNIKNKILNIKNTYQKLKFLEIDKCELLEKRYPLLNDYYQRLFSGELGFIKVAQFTSYPRLELFGKTLVEFPDEEAEETWTVFDHPVIRIYQNKL